jgi:type II secretory pathway pseudopilin PulG
MKNQRPISRSARTCSRRARQPRRGSWLVQVVVTMTIMSVLMTIASTSLFQMLRQESRMVERTFQTSTWLQLSREFRQDVHAALAVKQTEAGSRLELTTPDGPVTWVADGEKVRRISQRLEAADAADSPAISSLPGEQYVFVDHAARLSLTVGASGTASVASIEVAPLPTPNGGVVPPNVVVATVGLDHRFLASAATAEEQP